MSLLVVAKKEFAEQVGSRRFIVLTLLTMLVVAYALHMGLRIAHQSMRAEVLQLFIGTGNAVFALFGAGLGLLAGFDLITREREQGTLKVLLSHPVPRDAIILGKAAGAFAAISLAVACVLAVATGAVLIYGMPLSIEELADVAAFGGVTVIYIFTYFSFGIFASAVAKSSGTALTISALLLVFFSAAVPVAGELVSSRLAGEPPAPPVYEHRVHEDGSAALEVVAEPDSQAMRAYEQKMAEYMERKRRISAIFGLFSPVYNYKELVRYLMAERTYGSHAEVLNRLAGFVAMPAVFFTLGYVRFVREDVV